MRNVMFDELSDRSGEFPANRSSSTQMNRAGGDSISFGLRLVSALGSGGVLFDHHGRNSQLNSNGILPPIQQVPVHFQPNRYALHVCTWIRTAASYWKWLDYCSIPDKTLNARVHCWSYLDLECWMRRRQAFSGLSYPGSVSKDKGPTNI